MTKKTKIISNETWQWKTDVPFTNTIIVGDQVFISGQLASNEQGSELGDIAAQTRHVFENMKASLAEVGLSLSDLVRLNTYYVFDGDDADATQYWEDMTAVRLEYFPDPGPAATAVRVKGMPYKNQLIQIEGIALQGASRQNRERIMPDGSWDWSISVPLSQGWRVNDRIFVGGQISADKKGASVGVGDLATQTHNIYKYIGQVLSDAEASFNDVVHIKICFKYDSKDPDTGKMFVDRIMEISKEYAHDSKPVLTAFAVDLLYPGLDLEIDAMAIIDDNKRILKILDLGGHYQPSMFSDGVCANGEVYVAGQTALNDNGTVDPTADFDVQVQDVFERLFKVLTEANVLVEDVVKLNMFIVGEDQEIEGNFHKACELWEQMFPMAHPAMTTVRVHELARPGLLVQADCVALKASAVNK